MPSVFIYHLSLTTVWIRGYAFPVCTWAGGPASAPSAVTHGSVCSHRPTPMAWGSSNRNTLPLKSRWAPGTPSRRQPCSETGSRTMQEGGQGPHPSREGAEAPEPHSHHTWVCTQCGSQPSCWQRQPGDALPSAPPRKPLRTQRSGWGRQGKNGQVPGGAERAGTKTSPTTTAAFTGPHTWLGEPGAKWTCGTPCSKILITSRW